MELNTQENNIKKSPSCMDNKKITSKNLSFIEGLNVIKPLNTGGYKKVNFAIKTCEFYKREQPELSQLPYSPPVEKLLLPYTYYQDDLVSPSDIFENSITIEHDLPIKINLENTHMKITSANAELINTNRKNLLINDFGINKIKQFFYNSIEKIQSTGKIQALVVKNKLNPRKEDLYSVKFYSKNGVSEIQKANKQDIGVINEEKNPPISLSDKDKEQFIQTKSLKNEIHELEKKILHYEHFNNADDKFKYTKSTQDLISECISSPFNKRNTKFSATIDTMNGLINELNVRLSSLKKNEEENIKLTSKKNIFNSNESLSSNSSSYFSETVDESGYSSEEAENRDVINNIINQKSHELENQKLKNTETPHKKTYIPVKPKKITYKFNGEIYQTNTSISRAKHNSKIYQFALNGSSPKIISNNGKPDTTNLDTQLKNHRKQSMI
ncbi:MULTISPECIES: hypothetical protein [Providencia]|uniref:hypothetical protein n=2 Tax=Morganellaceae TaxID=1903414 RepID=UPI001373AA4E|nr:MULTISPECIES: hypothetical protein [unclassified Providencia]MBW3103641.1 hypothetical protein [Providencia rettgeri]BBU97905.1 hypothetical protein BML2496_37880 [Providencia rettgeri]